MSEQKPLAVIKVGGDVLLNKEECAGLGNNINDLYALGWNIIVLHGGGPQVNRLQQQHGLQSNKVAGRRITSESDLLVVKQAIAGEVNVDLVSLLASFGLPAFGCHGASGMLIKACKRPPIKVSGEGEQLIDFGEVGNVLSINNKLLHGLLELGQIPVIATLGINDQGRVFNINADTTVVEIAKVMKADLLLLITQIGGIYKDLTDPTSLLSEINPKQSICLIEQGVIKDGMIPKVEEAVKLLKFGIKSIAITAARREGIFKALATIETGNINADTTQIKATRICASISSSIF